LKQSLILHPKFLCTVGIRPPTNPSESPGRLGTWLLPLWTPKPSLLISANASDYTTFIKLYEELIPVIVHYGTIFKVIQPTAFTRSRAILTTREDGRIEQHAEMNGFASTKTSVNMKMDAVTLSR
jgi:hypothetical protein